MHRCLPEDDEPPRPPATALLSDTAISALGDALGEACKAPRSGAGCAAQLPLGVRLRLKRAAAVARDNLATREATQRQVVAYLELVSEPVLKALYVVLYGASLAALVLLCVQFALERGLEPHYLLESTRAIPIFNIALAATLFVITAVPFAYLLYRVRKVHAAGLVYSTRRRVTTQHRVAVCALTLLLQIFYLVPNILMLRDPCSAFEPWCAALVCVLIEWLLWSAILSLFLLDIHWRLPRTKERSSFVERIMLLRPPPPERPDSSFLDLGWSWRVTISKVIMYCVFEALFISTWVSYNRQPRLAIWHDACLQGAVSTTPGVCNLSPAVKALTTLTAVCLMVYFIWFIVIAIVAWRELAHRPYKGHRMANQTLRMSIGLTAWPMLIIILSMNVLWLSDWDHCNALVLVWPGLAPPHIQMAAYAFVNAIMVLPYSRVQPRAFLQAALQEFAWTRADTPAALDRRAKAAGGGACAHLADEPLFCVETALEACWFALLAYEDAAEPLPGVPDKDKTLPVVMHLLQLDSMVAFHEHDTAMHAIVAWSPQRLIVAFRGTAEPANMMADMQMCLTASPALKLGGSEADAAVSAPGRLFGNRPAVHRGFMHTWTHARINQRIVSFLAERVRQATAAAGAPPHVLLCGHSLGGALATLAAMDLRDACGDALPPSHLTVITFGCPRVGSAALARFYDAAVCPSHWNVVNQHDVITHGGRLFGLYKHVGKRILINPRGDMIVRPDFVEASFQHWIGSESLDDHYLHKYRDAFRTVCCQHNATDQRLDELLQAMGARPMTARRAPVLSLAGLARHAKETADAERKERAARRVPQWMRGLLARMRSPSALAESCQEAGTAGPPADERV